jgi:hyperosmotically inducible protein
MKRALKMAAGLSVFAVALPLAAADRDNAGQPNSKSQQRFQVDRPERLTSPVKASEIIGKQVTDAGGQKLGKVDELAVDVESGRVSLVLLNVGGVLGVGGKTVAIPPRAFADDPMSKSLRLDIDKNKISAAPEFDMAKWKEGVTTNQIIAVYRHYGQEPYFVAVREVKTARTFRTERASKVIGFPVVNSENKKCGDVDNLVVDLPAGRILHVVVASGGFLGVGDSLNAVPPSALSYTPSGDALLLNLSKEKLTQAPSFKKNEWPDFKDPQYSGKVYRSYGVDPYFSTDADNTARNVRDRSDTTLTPLDQGTSEGDVLITRRIRQEMLARNGLSGNARNVKVITVNGRVTLRGPVNDEAEKEAINAIATRLANGNVDNQIEVKREP